MGRYDILLQRDPPPARTPRAVKPALPRKTSLPPSPEDLQHQRDADQPDRTRSQPNTTDRPTDRASARALDRPEVRPPGRRTLGRVAFEFYLDQVETLRRLSLEQKMRGEKGSMSEMVREALDQYLVQPHTKKP